MKPISAFFLGASLLTLSACNVHDYVENFDHIRTAKTPIVHTQDKALDLTYADRKTGVSKSHQDQLTQFITQHDVTRQDDLLITYDATKRAVRRAEKLQAYLKQFGLHAVLHATNAAEATTAQAVRLTVTQYTVQVPNCPDWSDGPYAHFNNQVSSNFGCATAANLGLMIANPKDLLQGRESSLADGVVLSNSLQGYREARPYPMTGNATGAASIDISTGDEE